MSDNPFELLELTPAASDEAIKQAYLAKVRAFPPDKMPEQFQRIRSAYEMIKTQKERLAYELFHIAEPDPVALYVKATATTRPGRPTIEQLTELLKETLF